MVLLFAVALGLVCGYLRAKFSGRRYQAIELKMVWLVLFAYLPQFLAFYLPATRVLIPDNWIPIILVGSQLLLLIFACSNRNLPGFWLLGLGLLSNFIVILLNGGMMPLMPQIAEKLVLPGSESMLRIGRRVGFGKDILLEKQDIHLWFLSDAILLPSWLDYPLAMSIGDILISMGAFWLLWQLGGPRQYSQEDSP